MKNRRYYLLAFAFLLLAACAPGRAPNVMEVSQAGDKRVLINEPGLAKKLALGEVHLRTLADGRQAQVMLKNTAKRDTGFEYRFLWYDNGGFEVSTLTAWLPATLSALEERGYSSTAPSAAAVNFKFMVRAPQPLTDKAQ